MKASENGASFEIVFVSSDRDEASFKEYYAEMPWLALPFEDRAQKQSVSGEFDVRLYYFCVLLFIYNAARLLWIECTIEVIP